MSPARTRPNSSRVFTFYSYKGGVGRTMALANVACELANRRGLRVVCVDWDLEAPGLHYYFGYGDDQLRQRPGLIEYLNDFRIQVSKGKEGVAPEVDDYLQPLASELASKVKHGSVRLLHCGRTDPLYIHRVRELDWERFYEMEDGYRIVETLKAQLLKVADVVLIDARAGQSDLGITPTVQLPDSVILLFTSNRQNLEGSAAIARRVVSHPFRRENVPHVLLVPSRVFPVEERYQRWIENEVTPQVDRLVADDVMMDIDANRSLLKTGIPVAPKLSIDERIVTLDDDTAGKDLRQAYSDIAQAIENLRRGLNAWAPSEPSASAERRAVSPSGEGDSSEVLDDLRKKMEEASERGDADGLAYLQFQAGQRAFDAGVCREAITWFQTCLSHHRSRTKPNAQVISVILSWLGLCHSQLADFERAWALFEQSLALDREAGDKRGQGVTLHEMAKIRAAQGQTDEAWALFEQSLELDREAGDKRGQGVTLYEMAKNRAAQGQTDEAWALFEQALALKKEAGDKRGQGVTLREMAKNRAAQGQTDEAWALFEQALALDREAGDKRGQSITLHAMGLLARDCQQPAKAEQLFTEALELARQANAQDGVKVCTDALERLKAAKAGGN